MRAYSSIKRKLLIRRSSAGLGLFAGEPIKKGEFVVEYTGEILSNEVADRRGGKYLFEISNRRVVDGTSRSNIARYINHSCKPNCEPDIRRGRILIFARHNIKEGEELTYDYGKEYMDDFIKPKGCKCASCVL